VDHDSFEELIAAYAKIIGRICRAYTDTQTDFDDYFQEVCLQIWRSHTEFQGRSEESTWVYRLTLNVCMTLLKKDKRANADLIPDQLPARVAIRDPDTSDQNIERLYAAIRQLPQLDRAIILLHLERKSYQEIASTIDSNANSVGVRISRIRRKLKQHLEKT